MQIKISFNSDKDIILPIHYNFLIQAFIYNNIDGKLATFLHDNGYMDNGRTFKLFTFSRILSRGKKVDDKFNFGRKIQIIVSSPLDDFCKSIANFMLQSQDLYIGGNNINVDQIQIINNSVEKDEIKVETLSSMVAYSTLLRPDGSKYTCYFSPRETDFKRIVSENTIRKFNALNKANLSFDNGIEIVPLSETKQNYVYYKNILIKGASGKFIIKGKKELLQLGLDAGFGSKNSQGFGCVKLI